MRSIEKMIENETRPEVLREMALTILENNKLLAEENEKLKKLKALEEERQKWLSEELKKRLVRLHRQMFKKGRESTEVGGRERLTSEQEVLLHAQSLTEEEKKKEAWRVQKVEELHEASEDTVLELARERDPLLKKENVQIEAVSDFFENSTEITIVERQYKKIVHKRQKYRVTNKTTGKELLVSAPGPVRLFPKCRFSVDFATTIVTDKFLDHLPYERQRRRLERKGMIVEVRTLSRLAEMVSLHLGGIAEKVREEIFAAPLAVHIDETPWPILSKKDSNGYMWVISNQAGSYFRFEPSRSKKIAQELLEGYEGSVLSDAYPGYLFLRKSEKINWGCCWAHGRRLFYNLKDENPEEVKEVLELIDQLFAIERRAATWDQLKVLRETESKSIVEMLKTWLEENRLEFFNESDMREAIDYSLNHWQELTAFLTDTTLPLSNNDAERALRQSVLGRKNFNGSKTINGADVASVLYTVIETCKKAQLDPSDYIKYVVTENHFKRQPLTPLALAKLKCQ